uniref:Uncharacterized protein n=1 Tax=Zea mays TaxID=4577 RepID=C4IZA7_MAIZE|nr:unknown [Zea mays]
MCWDTFIMLVRRSLAVQQLRTPPSVAKLEGSLLMQSTVTYMEMPHNRNLPSFLCCPSLSILQKNTRRCRSSNHPAVFTIHPRPLRQKAPAACLSG